MTAPSARLVAAAAFAAIGLMAALASAQRACDRDASTLDNEAAPVPARVAAAQALGGCTRGPDGPRAVYALLRLLYAADVQVQRAVHRAIEQSGLATTAAVARLPPLQVLDQRARRFVDARFHDPN